MSSGSFRVFGFIRSLPQDRLGYLGSFMYGVGVAGSFGFVELTRARPSGH